MAVYDSKDSYLMDFCTSEWIRISKDHKELKNDFNVVYYNDEVIDVTGCKRENLSTNESSKDKKLSFKSNTKTELCDVIKIA